MTKPSNMQQGQRRRNSEKTPADLLIEKTAQEKMLELRKVLSVSDEYVESFPRHLAEKLDVCNDVVIKMMGLEEMQALRKRAKILSRLEDCKMRIVTTLEMADETADDIPWGKEADDVKSPDLGSRVMFHDPNEEIESEEKWKRKAEQSRILCSIAQYIKACKSKDSDMAELIDWMSNFAFDITWDEVGVKPIEERESEEMDMYRGMVIALQKTFQCARKIDQLIQLLVSDDTYDVISSKLPPHIAAARKKKKAMPSRKLWCSNKLRNKLDQYSKLRSALKEPKKGNQGNLPKQEVTVLKTGEEPENNPYKEVEALILREIGNFWKEASLDIMYFVQEVITHRFTKPSCKKRLDRALLFLEFINAAIEGKLTEANQTAITLKDTQATVNRMHDEATQMQKEISETQKVLQAARRKITKQKKNLEGAARENEKLNTKIGTLNDQIASLQKHVEELQDLPNQSEFDECKERLDELEEDFAELEQEVEEAKSSLNAKTVECEGLKKKLDEEKDVSANLAEEVQAVEEENEKMQKQIQEMEEKLSAQENNIMSLRLMVYYKDEVIRRLKQAAIELKSSEKQRKSPRKPPPSPVEETKSSSESVAEEAKKEEIETVAPVKEEAKPEEVKEKKETAAQPTPERVPGGAVPSDEGKPVMKYDQKLVSDRLTAQASKPVRPPRPTRVIFKPDERQELIENCQRAYGEIQDLQERLNRMSEDYSLKIKTAVDKEKNKSVLDKMKNEEELQNLCFAVCDETMRVQKELRKFNDHLTGELGMLINLKGKVFEGSGGDETRTTAGLMTMQTSTLGGIGPKRRKRRRGRKGQALTGLGAVEGKFGGEQGGIPDMMSMMSGLLDGDMGGLGGPNMPFMASDNQASEEVSEDFQQENIKPIDGGYWKSLRTAVVGKNAAAKESPPAPKEKRNSLAAKVLAEKQRRASLAVERHADTVPRFSSGYSADSEDTNDSDFLRLIAPSSGVEHDELSATTSPRMNTPLTDVSTRQSSPAGQPPMGIVVTVTPELNSGTESSTAMEGGNEGAPKLLNVVDRRMARLGQRRRSSMLPLQDVLQIARRQSIRAPPPPKVIKFRGFFPEFGDGRSALDKKRDALAREEAARRRRAKLEEEEAAKKKARKKALAAATGIDDDPLKQAEVFVRNISSKVMGFLSGMGTNLVDAIKSEKMQASAKLQFVEQQLVNVRMQARAAVTIALEEKEKKEAEAKQARKALIELLTGKSQEQWTPASDKSFIPSEALAGLKQLEDEMVATQEKLLKAAKKHTTLADDYQRRSFVLSAQVQENERAKLKVEAELRRKQNENTALRVQLHELRKSETQKMFMSIHDHTKNRRCLEECSKLDDNVKKLGLALLDKSMSYPRVRLQNLVLRYRQHCAMRSCIDTLRCKLKEEHSSRARIQGCRESKSVRTERSLLRNLLSRLESRYGTLSREWDKVQHNLEENRQKTLVKLTILFHKLRRERRDVRLIQPSILKITGQRCERARHKSPVAGAAQAPCKNLRAVFPLSDLEVCGQRAAPNTPASAPSESDEKWRPEETVASPQEELDVVGTKPPEDKSKLKRAPAQWFPDQSIFCPFSNRSGRLAPVNSRLNVQLEANRNHKLYGVALPPLTPATKASLRRHKRSPQLIEFPRILELDVQARLRQAKAAVVNNLRTCQRAQLDATHSYSSQIHIRPSDNTSSWNSSMTFNSSMSWFGTESLGEYDIDSDFSFPPLVPDLKRPSSIPSPQRSISKRKTSKGLYDIQSSWLFADTRPAPGQPAAYEKTKLKESSPSSPSGCESSSGSSTSLPSIHAQ